ncbi:MAG TPA: hypothetical protein VKY81_07120 [Natronosporangium sp.]|nr:hypothetical protein [Natronosporangium sp.]
MPVTRYRSVEEMGPPPASDSPAENLRAACELMELCYRLHPWPVHRGVRRLRGVDAPPEPVPPTVPAP